MAKSKTEEAGPTPPELFTILDSVDTEVSRFNYYTSDWEGRDIGQLVIGWMGLKTAKDMNDYLEFKANE